MTACVLPHEQPKPADHGALLCEQHRRQLRNQVTALPALSDWLHLHLAAGGATLEPVSGSREAPTPLRLDILGIIGPAARFTVHEGTDPNTGKPFRDQQPQPNIHGVLSGWTQVVGEEQQLDSDDEWPADTIPAITEWLARRISWIATQEWAPDMAAEIADLHQIAWKLAPIRPGRRRILKPCPSISCDLMALVLEYVPDEAHPYAKRASIHEYPRVICDVRAGGCNRIWRQNEYDWLGHVLSGGAA